MRLSSLVWIHPAARSGIHTADRNQPLEDFSNIYKTFSLRPDAYRGSEMSARLIYACMCFSSPIDATLLLKPQRIPDSNPLVVVI